MIYLLKPHLYPIRSDGVGYYSYLPSYLIHKDLSMKKTLETIPKYYTQEKNLDWTYILKVPKTDNYLPLYPIGEAVMMLPFFAVGHLLTLLFDYPPDGFSTFYQFSVGLAGLFYMILGLFFLKRILEGYFSEKIVTCTLLGMLFATNLFHFGTYDAFLSHIFSFSLFTGFLYLIPRWYKKPSYLNSVFIALVSGFITLVRLPNTIVLLFFPLYGIINISDIKKRLQFLYSHKTKILAIIAVTLLTIFPQFLLYKLVTGNWIINTYDKVMGFNFLSPEILKTLFSAKGGVFFWSPILLFALFALIFYAKKRVKEFLIPSIIFLTLQIYIVASWQHWWYKGGIGHRAFTESSAIFALFLATFYDAIDTKKYIKPIVTILSLFFAILFLFQTAQYWAGILPGDGMTWELYKDLFFKIPNLDKIIDVFEKIIKHY